MPSTIRRRSARPSRQRIPRTSARRGSRHAALGSGRIFPVAQASIAVDALAIAPHWAQIGGIDFGWDHPTAAVKLAWDRDADVVYVTAGYRVREATPLIHAAL